MSTFTEHRGDTATTEAAGPLATGHGRDADHGNRLLITLVVVLAAAVVGLSAWMIVDRTSTPDTATTDEIQQLLDDYNDAWNNADGTAYLELVTDNATFRMVDSSTPAQEEATAIDSLDTLNWHVEPIGDAIMTGDGPWYVAQANRLTADIYPDEGYTGLSVMTIVDDGGTLRVANHTYIGQS